MAVYNVSTSQPPSPNVDGMYPRSRISQSAAGGDSIIRSRTWSEDITKDWNETVSALETVGERVNRYLVYFSLTPEQLRVLVDKFRADLENAVESHHITHPATASGNLQHMVDSPKVSRPPSSLKCLDTYIPDGSLPRGHEEGRVITVDFSGPELQAAHVVLKGQKELAVGELYRLSLRDGQGASANLPLGLMDRKATASQLFDAVSGLVMQVAATQSVAAAAGEGTTEANAAAAHPSSPKNADGAVTRSTPATSPKVALSIGFPCEQRGFDSACLMHWTKSFQTGRSTNDPVEGMDVAALLTCAFFRRNSQLKVSVALNDTVATLLACCYELPPRYPAPRMALLVGSGVNAAYIQPDAEALGFVGSVFNCEIGGFDKSLPLNDVDLEVDFADVAGRGTQLFEKMCATTYLGEICRRLVVKVWQNEAPPLSWVRYSMPWLACVRIIEDRQDDQFAATAEVLEKLWEWSTTVNERRTVQKLFEVVFDRAAALCSVALVAIAQRTERLQPAMGGLTCAFGGALPLKLPHFVKRIQATLSVILGDSARLLHLQPVTDGALKGAAILTALR